MDQCASERTKMLAGELYLPHDAELVRERRRAKALCHRYNQQPVERDLAVLRELLGYATDAYLEPPFFCDYGYNLRFGRNIYANHNLVILDVAPVDIGDNVLIGPNVVISAAGHPIDPQVRASGFEFAKPVRIGANVWIGAGVVLLPGVIVGDNATVGAGSVVTKAIPANTVAAGNPCRVLRHLH
jgi:maltose O-acetyltransferase